LTSGCKTSEEEKFPMGDIQILDLRLLKGDKPTKAFCDVRVGDITIRDFKVYQTNGKPSVKNPSSTYKDQTGTLKFREIIILPLTVQTEVNALILSAYFRRLKENHHGTTD
jgi:hypothetical protein